MGAFKSAVITSKGQALLAKAVLNTVDLEFTKIAVSETKLTGDLVSKTGIGTIAQSVTVASVKRTNNSSVKVSASIANNNLTSGYYVRTIGLYAKDPDEGEILYSISVADESSATADWMPPYNGVGVSSLMIDLITVVGNSDNVKVEVDPTAFATVAQIVEVHEHLTALDNTVTTTTEKTLKGSVAGGLKINKVLGKCEQDSTTGANLANIRDWLANGLGTLNADGSLTLTTVYANNLGKDYTKALPSGTYTISNISGLTLHIQFSQGDYREPVVAGASKTFTYDGTSYLRFVYMDQGANTSVTYKIMLNKGDTALPHEPYTGGIPSPNPYYPQEIRKVVVNKITTCGKNLCKTVISGTNTYQGITYTAGNDGNITLNGTADDNLWYQVATAILEAGKTYTLTGNSELNLGLWDHTIGAEVKVKPVNTEEVIFIPNNSGLYSVNVKNARDTSFSSIIANIMIRHADIADDTYEPYKENFITLPQPIELSGTGDVMDELTPNEVVRNLTKIVLDGSTDEQWLALPTYNSAEYNAFYTRQIEKECLKQWGEALCDKLQRLSWGDLRSSNIQGFCVGDKADKQIIIRVPNSVSDVSALRDWLADNPLTIIYPIATPIIEPLPVVDQIALRSPLSHAEVTQIFTDSELEPTMEVEYGTNKTGAHTLTGLLTAQRNELKLAELTTAVLALNQE